MPQDFGIAGFSGFDIMEAVCPSLTSVYSSRYESGYRAVLTMRRRIEGEDTCERIIDLGFKVMKRGRADRTAA